MRLIHILVALALVSIVAIVGSCAERSALWHVVHDLCVVDESRIGKPAPCEEVHLADGEAEGYAVLKSPLNRTEYLLIPTRRLSGIESRDLVDADTPNYWRAAWAARPFVSQRAGVELPRHAIGMAINSVPGRSQDQLHIHIDCVRQDVAEGIRRHQDALKDAWTPLPFDLDGGPYLVRRVDSADLDGVDPFRLLAEGGDGGAEDRADDTLVVVGASFAGDRPGFVLLAGRADPANDDTGHGEDLLDHSCSVAASAAGLPAGSR